MSWVLGKWPVVVAILAPRPGAWIPAVTARQNQAINEMYYRLGPPCPRLWVKAKTVLCLELIKHTHLVLTSGDGAFHLWGQDHGCSPLGERLPHPAAWEALRNPGPSGESSSLPGPGEQTHVYIVLEL